MKNRRSLAWLFALVAVLSLLASACGSSSPSKTASTTTTAGSGGGSSTTAAPTDTSGMAKLTGTLHGQGSSFQNTFEQQVASDFGKAVSAAGGSATVLYTKTGSADGKKQLGDKAVGFAGSDSPIKPAEQAAYGTRKILYFPIVGGPISVAYNLKGVSKLQLSSATIAGIYMGKITTWNDAAITKDNPGATLPSTKITVVHRSDGSGTTSNFSKFLAAAAPSVFTLTPGDSVTWPNASNFQGGQSSTGVIAIVKSTDGAIGYADLADAAKANLDVASVGNSKGQFIAPTPDSASTALANATVAADLTYNPLNVDAAGAYPITSPTWILVDAKQKDKATADLLTAYLHYVLTTGQAQAKTLLYAPLPDALAQKALAQLTQITVG